MTNPASRITSVRPLPSDPGTVSVRVDGRVVGRVAVEMVDRLALAPGASWSTERAAAFARAAATDATRRAALGCLRRRSRSTASLRAWLTERGHDIGVIAEVIGDLHARGLLDDERHGRDLARALLARRPAAWRFLVERLEQSGLAPVLAERIATDAVAGVDPVDAALTVAGPVSGGAGDPRRHARRVAGTLQRRGFDENTIRLALHRLGLLEVLEAGSGDHP